MACAGITQKGAKCKRTRSPGSSYCFNHFPKTFMCPICGKIIDREGSKNIYKFYLCSEHKEEGSKYLLYNLKGKDLTDTRVKRFNYDESAKTDLIRVMTRYEILMYFLQNGVCYSPESLFPFWEKLKNDEIKNYRLSLFHPDKREILHLEKGIKYLDCDRYLIFHGFSSKIEEFGLEINSTNYPDKMNDFVHSLYFQESDREDTYSYILYYIRDDEIRCMAKDRFKLNWNKIDKFLLVDHDNLKIKFGEQKDLGMKSLQELVGFLSSSDYDAGKVRFETWMIGKWLVLCGWVIFFFNNEKEIDDYFRCTDAFNFNPGKNLVKIDSKGELDKYFSHLKSPNIDPSKSLFEIDNDDVDVELETFITHVKHAIFHIVDENNIICTSEVNEWYKGGDEPFEYPEDEIEIVEPILELRKYPPFACV